MRNGLKLGWGGLVGEYVGFLGGPIEEYTRTSVQGSYRINEGIRDFKTSPEYWRLKWHRQLNLK